MNAGEQHDEQSPNYVRRRFNPCRCDAAKGDYDMARCPCSTEEDGTVSHRGCEAERYQHEPGGYPRQA